MLVEKTLLWKRKTIKIFSGYLQKLNKKRDDALDVSHTGGQDGGEKTEKHPQVKMMTLSKPAIDLLMAIKIDLPEAITVKEIDLLEANSKKRRPGEMNSNQMPIAEKRSNDE